MPNYIDRAYLEIDGTVIDCSAIEETTADGVAPVPTMNRENRAKGYSGGVMQYTFTATVPIPEDDGLPVDFYQMKRDKVLFGASIIEQNGATISFVDCRIGDISRRYAGGEASEFSLECFALDRI